MTPIQWVLRPLKKYAVFSGRAPRAEYWWFSLASVIVCVLSASLDRLIWNSRAMSTTLALAVLLPWSAVTVRRLHDTNRSTWWILAAPFGVGAALMAGSTVAIGSRVMRVSPIAADLLMLAMLGAGLISFVLTVLPGTRGSNRYGPDPHRPKDLKEVFA